MSSHPSKGFTLIELLTVIAVIGVLAALLIPTLGSVRAHARSAQCASNLRQIGVAILGYANENRGALPEVAHVGSAGAEKVSWIHTLRPWLGNADAIRICPSDRYANELRTLNDGTSYVLNDLVFTYPGDGDDGFGGVSAPKALARIDRVRNPQRTLFAMVINDDIWPRNLSSDHIHAEGWSTWQAVIADISPDVHRAGSRSSQRSSGKSNYLFGDGHVESWDSSRLRARVESGENPAVPAG